MFSDLTGDFSYGIRSLWKDHRFAAPAALALALGIGAATVAFSTFYNLLFNAFAARHADRLAVLSLQDAETGKDAAASLTPLAGTISDLDAIRQENHVFEDVIGYQRAIGLLNDGARNHQVYVGRVSGNAFDFYGVPPVLGRGIIPEDVEAGSPPVFVMSYKLWSSEFGENKELIGKTSLLDKEQRTLVGVMPRRFQPFGALQQIWIPISKASASAGRNSEPTVDTMMARRKPGVTLDAASADLDVVVKSLAKSKPPQQFPKHFSARAQSATDFLLGPTGIGSAGGMETAHLDIKHMLYDLMAGVALLLLIACSGAANLLLARGSTRGKEIALRTALGASRTRLVQLVLTESALLAAAGCALGCVFAYYGMKIVSAVIPHKGQSIGGEALITLNPTVLAFAIGITVVATFACGLAPALYATRRDVQPMLAGGFTGSGGRLPAKLLSIPAILEVSLSVVLLTGAGLMLKSFYTLTHIELGFDYHHLFVAVARSQIDTKKIADRLKILPGVVDVAIENSLPGYNPGRRFESSEPGSNQVEMVGFDGCSANLPEVLQLRMATGRWFSKSEEVSAQPLAVINQTAATHFFHGENPLGQSIEARRFDETIHPGTDMRFQIIGIVRDTKNFGLQVPVQPMAFVPYTINGGGLFFLRTNMNPSLISNAVRETIWAMDPDALFSPETGPYSEEFQRLTYSAHELGLTTFVGVAGTALLLVLIGVFSVLAYTVSQRTQEIGVRMAVGAQRQDILRLVLRTGFKVIVAGLCIGMFASLGLTRFLASEIWGVSLTDPLTFTAVALLLLFAGLLACYIPARRATAVDPLVALRYE